MIFATYGSLVFHSHRFCNACAPQLAIISKLLLKNIKKKEKEKVFSNYSACYLPTALFQVVQQNQFRQPFNKLFLFNAATAVQRFWIITQKEKKINEVERHRRTTGKNNNNNIDTNNSNTLNNDLNNNNNKKNNSESSSNSNSNNNKSNNKEEVVLKTNEVIARV